MSAAGKWFVMMWTPSGNNVIPLVDDDDNPMLWETEDSAYDAAMENDFANAFGFHVYEVGE